jgi:hypothetical protein
MGKDLKMLKKKGLSYPNGYFYYLYICLDMVFISN